MMDGLFLPPPEEPDFDALSRTDYFVILRKRAFVDGQIDRFTWGNANADLVAYYVGRFPIDEDVVRALCEFFQESRNHPFTAREALKKTLSANTAKRAEVVGLIDQFQLEWPEPLLGPKPQAPSG